MRSATVIADIKRKDALEIALSVANAGSHLHVKSRASVHSTLSVVDIERVFELSSLRNLMTIASCSKALVSHKI